MNYGKPSWVYEQEATLREISHRDETSRLRHRIEQLERENSDLKEEIAKMENTILVALDLLTKRDQSNSLY